MHTTGSLEATTGTNTANTGVAGTTTGTSAGVGTTASTMNTPGLGSSNYGPHSTNMGNKIDPTVDSDLGMFSTPLVPKFSNSTVECSPDSTFFYPRLSFNSPPMSSSPTPPPTCSSPSHFIANLLYLHPQTIAAQQPPLASPSLVPPPLLAVHTRAV